HHTSDEVGDGRLAPLLATARSGGITVRLSPQKNIGPPVKLMVRLGIPKKAMQEATMFNGIPTPADLASHI
ncbi:hypothetical protein KWH04_23885, partial [Xanthomonas campestris pv. trichodesmae]|nr:hypothetical protein [Xanthomonas campestris pv. trichodesmae]